MSRASSTETVDYTNRLKGSEARWKRVLGVQRIYARNLRSLSPGFMLDVGCGIGRNLRAVRGNAVGVDHNAHSVAHARAQGFEAYTPAEFRASRHASELGRFDSMLVSHVLEHMSEQEAEALLASYLPHVRAGGKLIVITPQERGYASDATHRRFVGFDELERLGLARGLQPRVRRSFPFPRIVGKVFTYNEFVFVADKP